MQIVEGLGADAYVYSEVQLAGDERQQIVVRTDGRVHPRRGEMLNVEAVSHHVHYFDAETGERIEY